MACAALAESPAGIPVLEVGFVPPD